MRIPFIVTIENVNVCVLMVEESAPLGSMPILEMAIGEHLDHDVTVKLFDPTKGNMDGNFTPKTFKFTFDNGEKITVGTGKIERTWLY